MDIYVVQWDSIRPPKKIFLGGKTPLSSKPRDLQIYFEINKNGG